MLTAAMRARGWFYTLDNCGAQRLVFPRCAQPATGWLNATPNLGGRAAYTVIVCVAGVFWPVASGFAASFELAVAYADSYGERLINEKLEEHFCNV